MFKSTSVVLVILVVGMLVNVNSIVIDSKRVLRVERQARLLQQLLGQSQTNTKSGEVVSQETNTPLKETTSKSSAEGATVASSGSKQEAKTIPNTTGAQATAAHTCVTASTTTSAPADSVPVTPSSSTPATPSVTLSLFDPQSNDSKSPYISSTISSSQLPSPSS